MFRGDWSHSANEMFTRELPGVVCQGDKSSGSFDLRSSRLPRDARGAQEDRVGNFRRTETPREQNVIFAIASPFGMRYSFASPEGWKCADL
jgi:hypothetical protein